MAAFVVAALLGATCARAESIWSEIGIRTRQNCTASQARWSLCTLFHITQSTASEGGPQALEGYTYVNHPRGSVGLAIGTLGNIELAATGDTKSARALQGGVVVSGPGRVEHATTLYLSQPKRRGDYPGPTQIERADYVTFDNGWSIRPQGDRLLICAPTNTCRDF